MVPDELKNLPVEEAKAVASENIRSACSVELPMLRDLLRESVDDEEIASLKVKIKAWKDKEARLQALLVEASSTEESAALLSKITGYADREW